MMLKVRSSIVRFTLTVLLLAALAVGAFGTGIVELADSAVFDDFTSAQVEITKGEPAAALACHGGGSDGNCGGG